MASQERVVSNRQYYKTFGGNAAENYERFFVPAIGRPLAQELTNLANLKPGERVLDVACGTGIVTRFAAEYVGDSGSVAGIDINPGMLAVARSKLSGNGTVEWHEANAENVPLPDESFDVVLCQLSLQFVPDKLSALREMHRVLVSGGRVYLNVPGSIGPLFEKFADGMERHLGQDPAGFIRHVFSLHDTDVLGRLLTDAGFREIDVSVHDKTLMLPPPKQFLWQYLYSTPLAEVLNTVDERTLIALEEDITGKWGEYTDNGAMRYRQPIIVSNAVK
jgi:ubiquinone/menaquinone biosynthesis C-methylase UbiE